MKYDSVLDVVKKECLVFDIETSAHYPNGKEIPIGDFENYVENAKVKWVGLYSYRDDKYYSYRYDKDAKKIYDLVNSHSILVGFNAEDFDFPIIKNNGLVLPDKFHKIVDCMVILGRNTFKTRNGFGYKDRGSLMDYKFKNNKLRTIAEAMGLETQKGDIDYDIFNKNDWTPEEVVEIETYLKADVISTKQMFDKLWLYWVPFTELLDEKSVRDLSWIRNSIASLTYKSACYSIGVDPTYGEGSSGKEEMGGHVYLPKYEEAKDVWYIDFASLYPHMFSCFNLFAETEPNDDNPLVWHGNDLFQVKGYYNICKKHPLTEHVVKMLKERIRLKKEDKDNPLVFAIKIFCNCFSNDTEIVMADNTIKKIKDCKIGEMVYTINPKSLMVEKKPIVKTISQNYDGMLHHYSGHYFDFKNTPNHRFLLQHKDDNKNISFIESKNIESQHKIPIHKKFKNKYKKTLNILDYIATNNLLVSLRPLGHARTWLYNNKLEKIPKKYNENNRNVIYKYDDIKNKLYFLLKQKDTKKALLTSEQRKSHKIPIFYDNNALSYLVGIYLAEGNACNSTYKKYTNGNVRGATHSIQISQYQSVNPLIYKKITDALDLCGLKYSAGKQAIRISGKIFYDFIFNNFGSHGDKCFKNKKMFEELNLEKVFEALIDGDGTKKSRLFTTKYDCLKDDFIELCMRLGYTFHISNDGCWRITYNNNANSLRKANRKDIYYNDKVYCVEVQDNNTILAGSDGKFNWTGNSLYGVVRSPIFEKVHTPNAGWDCCWLGQQVQKFTEDKMVEFGFEIIGGDTDSLMCTALNQKFNNKEYVLECLDKIVVEIKSKMPFPVDTFNIDIECKMDYVLFPFSNQEVVEENIRKLLNKEMIDGYIEDVIDKKKVIIDTNENKIVKFGRSWVKELRGKKKNYIYIHEEDGVKKIKIVGLPIKKDNSTELGIKIFNEVLSPLILKNNRAIFSRDFMETTVAEYLEKPGIIETLAREYKVQPYASYKTPESQIQAQISKHYFGGDDGVIKLIANDKIGKVGKGKKYCSIDEAKANKLTVKDLDLDKLWAELEPFIK